MESLQSEYETLKELLQAKEEESSAQSAKELQKLETACANLRGQLAEERTESEQLRSSLQTLQTDIEQKVQQGEDAVRTLQGTADKLQKDKEDLQVGCSD